MIVPKGKPTTQGGWRSHNEYIVYNINQAKIRYILKMNMNGQWMIIYIHIYELCS